MKEMRDKLRIQLIENRLMNTYEEVALFEEAMNKLYEEDDLKNIKYYCEAFDDNTEHHEVMFGMIHGIERYVKLFDEELYYQNLLESLSNMNDASVDWQNTIVCRMLNRDETRKKLSCALARASTKQMEKAIIILERIKKEDMDKFGYKVDEVIAKMKDLFSPYKTINGREFTKEEWEAYEEKEYRKYIEKKNKKSFSFFVEEDKTPQNFSAETGRLQNIEYIVFNSRADQVPVYQYPSTMVAPISFLNNGTAIQVLKYEEDDWCEVLSKNQKKGYIHSSFIKKNN